MNPPNFCEQCGAVLQPNIKFCEECGHPVESAASPSSPIAESAAISSTPTRTAPVPRVPLTGVQLSMNRTMLIALAVGAVVLFLILAFAFFLAPGLVPRGTAPTAQATSIPQAALATSSMPTQAPPPTNVPATMVTQPTTIPTTALTTLPTVEPMLAPISAPTATRTTVPTIAPPVPPTSPPTLPPGVLFQDDFNSLETSVQKGWSFVPQQNSRYTWSDDGFKFSGSKANISLENVIDNIYQDFAIETDAELTEGNSAWLGLVFRYNQNGDTADYYDLSVRSDGMYTLWFVKNSQGVDPALIPIQSSSAVQTGKQHNVLGVIAEGDTIAIYINRTLVKTVTDNRVQSGSVGIVAGTRTEPAAVTFHRFTVLTPEQARKEWGSESVGSAPPTNTAPAQVSGPEEKFFEVWSKGAVANSGATAPTTFRIDKPWLVKELVTYHWNNGRGMTPGTIALKAANGTVYGPWNASGVAGNAGLPDAAWSVKPNVIIQSGSYTVQDSDQTSWSQNAETGGAGMAYGVGINQAPAVAVPTTSAPQAPPGVYLIGLRVDPANPVRNQGVRFIGKFLNTTGKQQSMNWVVVIREPDAKKAFGETSVAGISIPVGTSEIASPDNWKVTGGGSCIPFYAQAFSVQADNSRVLLATTSGNAVSTGFNVCP